jgi:hypothetical protein
MTNNKRREEKRSKSKAKKKAAPKARSVTSRAKRLSGRKISGKKVRAAAKKKRSSKAGENEIHSPVPSTLAGRIFSTGEQAKKSGLHSRSAGQSGDVQAVSRKARADSESVEELLEEGQAREAAAISGVENALDPDQAEVRTREVPEDDVPEEYIEED